ncbi:LisH/CRA/RING-U-box domains-containing protein, partial [Perilla frutescens var. hirtella]
MPFTAILRRRPSPPSFFAVSSSRLKWLPPSKFGKLAESLKLDYQLLHVPFKHYKKTIRSNHRSVEKEVSAVISGVSDAVDLDLLGDEAVNQLSSLVSQLQGLKRK